MQLPASTYRIHERIRGPLQVLDPISTLEEPGGFFEHRFPGLRQEERAIPALEPYSGAGAATGGSGPFSSVFHLDRNAIQAEKRSRSTTPLVIARASSETGEFRKMRITTLRPTHVQGRACEFCQLVNES